MRQQHALEGQVAEWRRSGGTTEVVVHYALNIGAGAAFRKAVAKGLARFVVGCYPLYSAPRMRAFSKREVREFYRRLAATRPIPQTELEFISPFTLLVAVVLSAQATDTGVNKATRTLFALADTPAKMLALGEERLADAVKTIGLYRTKSKNVIALSEALITRHGGEVPADREALEAL